MTDNDAGWAIACKLGDLIATLEERNEVERRRVTAIEDRNEVERHRVAALEDRNRIELFAAVANYKAARGTLSTKDLVAHVLEHYRTLTHDK